MVGRNVLFFALAFLGVGASSAFQVPGSGWEAIPVGSGKIAVPKGWRDFRGIRPPMVIYRQGDGIGIPRVDETGAPLQAGMTVEKPPAANQSVAEIMEGLVKGANKAPRLEMVGDGTVEDVKLADGTSGQLLTAKFIKEGGRRSLQLMLVAKDAQGVAWIVSAFLVAGKDSQWPKPGSKYARWLQAHVTSLSFDPGKFDPESIEGAYKRLEKWSIRVRRAPGWRAGCFSRRVHSEFHAVRGS